MQKSPLKQDLYNLTDIIDIVFLDQLVDIKHILSLQHKIADLLRLANLSIGPFKDIFRRHDLNAPEIRRGGLIVVQTGRSG